MAPQSLLPRALPLAALLCLARRAAAAPPYSLTQGVALPGAANGLTPYNGRLYTAVNNSAVPGRSSLASYGSDGQLVTLPYALTLVNISSLTVCGGK
jgi:hypothetical protein